MKDQEKWWSSYGLFFTILPRRAILLRGFHIPLDTTSNKVLSTNFRPEIYCRPGILDERWGCTGWETVDDVCLTSENGTLKIDFKIPVIAQVPLSFYIFSATDPVIPSFVPNIHSSFTGKRLNDVFSEGQALRILVGRWGSNERFRMVPQDRRGFRGAVLYSPKN